MGLTGLIIGAAIDIFVLFFVAGFFKARANNIMKAILVTLISFAAGYILSPMLLVSLMLSLAAFFVTLFLTLFFRLILIKMVYKVSIGKAFMIWVVSAIVSIVVSMLLPF